MRLKLLTYNIHKGFNWNNRRYFIKEIKEFINSTQADLVFLQEVVGENRRHEKSGLVSSQFEFLADEIWSYSSYAKNAVYDNGHHGNVILSKYPLEFIENINLSTNVFEKRGMLLCKVSVENQIIMAASLHLNIFHNSRNNQYQKIIKYFKTNNQFDEFPLIIAGDFNDYNKKSNSIFKKTLGMQDAYYLKHNHHALTFPAFAPILSLDRIYIKKSSVINSHVIHNNNMLSDHLPLYCELNFP